MEGITITEETLVGRRRSTRCLGKRPCYAVNKQIATPKKPAIRKMPKKSMKKKVQIELTINETEHGDRCKGASTAFEQGDQQKQLPDNGDCGEISQMKNRSIADLHEGPVKSDKQRVRETIRVFNTHFLRFIQVSEPVNMCRVFCKVKET